MASPDLQELDADAIAGRVWQEQRLVLCAAPGAGKTTRVPWALLNHPQRRRGKIWVLEPRRLAARLAARFVAEQSNMPLGERIGYRVRDDIAANKDTELVYLTEGMFWRTVLGARSLEDALRDVACIVLDEFHGRSLALDVALGLLARWQRREPTQAPAVVVMSATLDSAPIAALLGDAPIVAVRGRLHPITVAHLPPPRTSTLALAVLAGVRHVLDEEKRSTASAASVAWRGRDFLVFLPGVAAIVAAQKALTALADREHLVVCPLHARLSRDEQDRALQPSTQRRIVLATNVAETSLTLPNVGIVIDSGLAFEPQQEPWTGIVRLTEERVSQASLVQRAGRAGRMTAGLCVRLFSLADEKRRPEYTRSEMERLPLSEAVLWLAALGEPPLSELPMVSPPPRLAVTRAHALLERLGALGEGGKLTELGRRLVQLPVAVRLGAMLLAAEREGVLDDACRAAAVLAHPPRSTARGRDDVGLSDLWPLCQPSVLSREQQDETTRLRRLFPSAARRKASAVAATERETALARAMLRGFCDRLACRQGPQGVQPGELPLAVAHLGRARLASTSRVRANAFMVVLAAQPSTTMQAGWLVTLASAVEPDWLVDLDDGRVVEDERLELSPTGRSERVVRLSYEGVLLYEQRSALDDAAQRRALLAQRAQSLSREQLISSDVFEPLSVRLALLATYLPQVVAELSPPPPTLAPELAAGVGAGDGAPAAEQLTWAQGWLETQLRELAVQTAAGGALPRGDDLIAQLGGLWPAPLVQALREQVPETLRLGGAGPALAVEYTSGAAPRITALLQRFYGREVGPSLLSGKLMLVLALCGPHGRPLQVTRDLRNFWREHYPKLRPALARRYPRHLWPEDPASASPEVHKRRGRG